MKQATKASACRMWAVYVFALSMSGCAAQIQALNGYEAAAATSIDAANDHAIKLWKYQMCQTPVSAALRNPDIVPAIKAMCLPAASNAPVSSVLDSGAK